MPRSDMANSKAYLSFVLLFAFLLSSHVLAHELHETSPKDSIRSDNAEVDELKESKNDWIFPQASRKIMLGTGRGHYTSLYVVAPNCKDGDPECEEDPCFRKQDPICFEWRAFATFPDKTSGMRHGGKTGYGVPRKEDVGGETMN